MIDDVKIGRVLGTGAYGKVYLCTYKGKKYAMKIQNLTGMMNEETKYTIDVWAEIELYKYINKMSPSDQVFFNRMYEYKVYNEMVKIGTNIGDSKRKWEKNIKNINNTGWRIKYLLEYKGTMTFSNFLYKYKSSFKASQIYSLCLQVLYIFSILKKGGYVHYDMHLENIMVNKTDKEYFIFNRKKVNYYGIQLSAIDYGKSINKKYKAIVTDKHMFTERKLVFHLQIIFDGILSNYYDILRFYEENNIDREPGDYEIGIKKIFINHLEFCKPIISEYLHTYPEAKETVKTIYSLYKTNIPMRATLANDTFYYDFLINKIERKFSYMYPAVFKKYFKLYRVIKTSIPKAECLEIYSFTDLKSIIKYFLNKV
jgi:serine/threonine protein kinase